MTLKDDLIAARALIDTPEKWCKGVEPGQNCAMWAVAKATKHPNGGFRWCDCRDALVKALPPLFRAPRDLLVNFNDDATHADVLALVNFNDDPATTHADVLAMFDRAIEAAP